MSKTAKREGPDPVAPVTIAGVRFEAIHWGKARGLAQNGGHVAAIDPGTGQELWTLKVYDVPYDPEREADTQDVFITRLGTTNDGATLTVRDESERVWLVDPAARTVREA